MVPSTTALGQRLERQVGRVVTWGAARPRVTRSVSAVGRAGGVGVLLLVSLGILMLSTLLRWWITPVLVLALAVLPMLSRLRVLSHPLARRALIAPVAVAVPVLALLAVNVIWATMPLPRAGTAVGLFLASVVLAATAYAYLYGLGMPPAPTAGRTAALASVTALVASSLARDELPEPRLLITAGLLGVALWVYLNWAVGPVVSRPLWWAVLLVLGFVIALPAAITAYRSGQFGLLVPVAAVLAAIVVGLNALGLSREPAGSKPALQVVSLVLAVGLVGPLVALLWPNVDSRNSPIPKGRPVPAPGPPASVPEIAHRFRPTLLFDGGERLRTPVDVDRLLEDVDVELCPEAGLLADCRGVDSGLDLRSGFGNLRFDTKSVEAADLPAVMYARVTRHPYEPGISVVDYWWYLPDNPTNTAMGAMCGAGLTIPDITCFDHQSDWEGVTVLVDVRLDRPVAVHYAAHRGVMRVSWARLRAATRRPPLKPFAAGRDPRRPLVFIASGTHAAYPMPCSSSTCQNHTIVTDNRHDGEHEWLERNCAAACVTSFPTRRPTGRASWNAFDGRWGTPVCIARRIYCSRTDAPRSPGEQDRYKKPWCYAYEILDLRQPARKVSPLPRGCRATTDETTPPGR